jgi:cellulose biosynthesis protein BcsQ
MAVTPRLDLPQPLIITIGCLKGGVGKTTTAFFIAAYFAIFRGLRVLVIDADPLSQSGYSWYRHIMKKGGRWPFDLIPFPSQHVGDCIDDNQASYDVIIVDTGGESADIFKAAVRKSRELIIACAPNDGELERVPPTFADATEAAAGVTHEIRVRVLLTKVPPLPSTEGKKGRDDLAKGGYDVFKHQATNWKWYRTAARSTNPLDDLAEYQDIGEELIADYVVEDAA